MPPGPEYKKLETDLNKACAPHRHPAAAGVTPPHAQGAAGHFVYLCYKKSRAEPPLTGTPAAALPGRDVRGSQD